MIRRQSLWIAMAALGLFVGCQPPADAPTPTVSSPETAAADVTLTESQIAEIKKLPEADQPIALAQKVCLVSGEPLGSMDVPVKVTHDGKTGFLCCDGCKPSFEDDPAGTLAKAAKP